MSTVKVLLRRTPRTPIPTTDNRGGTVQGGLRSDADSKKIDFAKALHRSCFLFEGTPLQRSNFWNAAPPQISGTEPPLKKMKTFENKEKQINESNQRKTKEIHTKLRKERGLGPPGP